MKKQYMYSNGNVISTEDDGALEAREYVDNIEKRYLNENKIKMLEAKIVDNFRAIDSRKSNIKSSSK